MPVRKDSWMYLSIEDWNDCQVTLGHFEMQPSGWKGGDPAMVRWEKHGLS